MPMIRKRVAATTANAIATEQNRFIGGGGAIVQMFAAGVTNSDDVGLLINTRQIVPPGTDINIEASADVIDSDRDQILFNELVEPGELSVPCTVTTELQFLIMIKPLPVMSR